MQLGSHLALMRRMRIPYLGLSLLLPLLLHRLGRTLLRTLLVEIQATLILWST